MKPENGADTATAKGFRNCNGKTQGLAVAVGCCSWLLQLAVAVNKAFAVAVAVFVPFPLSIRVIRVQRFSRLPLQLQSCGLLRPSAAFCGSRLCIPI
jgi:hypothetical protein